MAPKKKTDTSEAGENGGGKFTWEGANDYKLLLLTQGRYVKPEEYEQLASAFTGVTVGGIRNRISMLRVKQRDLYETLNWELPSGGAGHSNKKPSNKKAKAGKRDAEAFDDGDDNLPETPSKKPKVMRKMGEKTPPKPRAKKPKVEVKEESVLDEEGDEEMDGLGAGGAGDEAHGKGEESNADADADADADGEHGQEDEC